MNEPTDARSPGSARDSLYAAEPKKPLETIQAIRFRAAKGSKRILKKRALRPPMTPEQRSQRALDRSGSPSLREQDLLEIQMRTYLEWLERSDPDYQGALRRCSGCGSLHCRSTSTNPRFVETEGGEVHSRYARNWLSHRGGPRGLHGDFEDWDQGWSSLEPD